jgi:hypothetical protein
MPGNAELIAVLAHYTPQKGLAVKVGLITEKIFIYKLKFVYIS